MKFYFTETLRGAEQHWFFVQGCESYEQGLYLPAASALLNGLEATLRIYVSKYSERDIDWNEELSPYRVLSNKLVAQAAEIGLDVTQLAFDGEVDFQERLSSAKPNRRDIMLVEKRNNVCHGNVFEYIQTVPGTDVRIFIPEFVKPLVEQLLKISENWASELARFREEKEKSQS